MHLSRCGLATGGAVTLRHGLIAPGQPLLFQGPRQNAAADWFPMRLDFETLERQQTLAGLKARLGESLAAVGIDHFIYVTVDRARRAPMLLTNMSGLYSEPGPIFDPFLDYCCKSYEPSLTGVEFLDRHPYLGPADVAFIRRAASEDGFLSGVGLPVRLQGSERYGGFNLGTGLRQAAFEARVVPMIPELQLFALIAHRRIEELTADGGPAAEGEFRQLLLSDPEEQVSSLTAREKEVLFLIAKGFTTKEIARLCSISPHTAGDYRKSIYRKLEVSNAAAAVVEAGALGLI